jgi:hypothetical protein
MINKVNEWMALCDALGASFSATRTTPARLLDATVHEVLQPVGKPLAEAAA